MYSQPGGVSQGAQTGSNPTVPSGSHALPKIGRYDLLRRLGAGGMAEVHLARASGLEGFEKLLVLKRILPHLAADAHFVQMFLAEARLAAILQHPNVVQVFDLGQDASHFFFTMEFVYGENAYAIGRAARRRGELLPIEHAVTIARDAAAGLHYAHERVGFDGRPLGIVHRDVSPTNIMVTYDGCTKVADFGIAKVTSRTDVTQAGIRKGKVPYMSPEQCRAQRVDRRSDVFALGICLYELSTQTRLFEGDNEFGVMNRIVTGDIQPPSERRAGYPKDLERIVMRALGVDRDVRYASAQELQLELEEFVRSNRIDATQSSLARWMHRTFKPQPFPWGALQGDGVKGGAGAAPTLADSGAGVVPGSGGGVPASRPDMTPLSNPGSHPMPSSATSGLVAPSAVPVSRSRVTGPVTRAPSNNGTLKGVAMGLGVVAALAVATVGGMYLYMQTRDDPDRPKVASPAEASVAGSPEAAPQPEPEVASAPADPVEAEAEPTPDPTPEPAELAEAQAPPAAADSAEDAVPTADAERPTEPEPEPELEIVEVEEEPEPAKTKTKAGSKPKANSSARPRPRPTKKKKSPDSVDPNAFWGG